MRANSTACFCLAVTGLAELRPYLESPVLQRVVSEFFEADKPVAAICHGVLLVGRSSSKRTGKPRIAFEFPVASSNCFKSRA
jgi:hypothetical protein